jgi:hypothetical protein
MGQRRGAGGVVGGGLAQDLARSNHRCFGFQPDELLVPLLTSAGLGGLGGGPPADAGALDVLRPPTQ